MRLDGWDGIINWAGPAKKAIKMYANSGVVGAD